MRLVSQIWMKKAIPDIQIPTVPRNAVIESTSRPVVASVAMFSCCSTMAAPTAANPMTRAMICRCRDPRSSRSASPPPTPFSLVASADTVSGGRWRPMISDDTRAQARRTPPLMSTKAQLDRNNNFGKNLYIGSPPCFDWYKFKHYTLLLNSKNFGKKTLPMLFFQLR